MASFYEGSLCLTKSSHTGQSLLVKAVAAALLAGCVCGFVATAIVQHSISPSQSTVKPSLSHQALARHPKSLQAHEASHVKMTDTYGSEMRPIISKSPALLTASLQNSSTPWMAGILGFAVMAVAAIVRSLHQKRTLEHAAQSRASYRYSVVPSATANSSETPAMAMATLFGFQPPPFINPLTLTSVGLIGDWEEVAGNYIAFPPPPRRIKGIVYFLGGFFFGRVPQVLYRNMLEEMVREGYVVVATPYQLQGFDYQELTEGIVLRVNSAEGFLRRRLSDVGLTAADLPQFAVGHSCGALLQFLIESFHPDLARQRTGGSVFISYNNKRVTDAIPALDQVVSPLAKTLYGNSGPSLPGGASIGETIGQQFSQLRAAVRGAVQATTSLPLIPPIIQNELLPFEEQVAPLTAQIGPLLEAVAKDSLDFNPTSEQIRQKAIEAYDAPRTLVVQFEVDNLDETPVLQDVLKNIDRIAGKVQYEKLPGNHFTPLVQDPLPLDRDLPPDAKAIAQAINTLSGGLDQQVRSAALNDYNQLSRVLMQWLEDGVQEFESKKSPPPSEQPSETNGDWDLDSYDELEPSA